MNVINTDWGLGIIQFGKQNLWTKDNLEKCHEYSYLEKNRKKYLDYDVLVVPGGVKALEKLRLEEGVVEFVREWNALDKTIFSLCNGAQLLITADVIKGKTVSGYYAIEADINNAGATYHRGPVVVDSNIVSSPHYDFMGEWMRTGYEVLEQRGK